MRCWIASEKGCLCGVKDVLLSGSSPVSEGDFSALLSATGCRCLNGVSVVSARTCMHVAAFIHISIKGGMTSTKPVHS